MNQVQAFVMPDSIRHPSKPCHAGLDPASMVARVALGCWRALRLPLDLLIAADGLELIRLQALYRGTRPAVPVEGRTVIVVDDGIATGNSMRNALKTLRGARPEWVVVAVPVAPPEAQFRIGTAADEFACLECSPDFDLVGQCYRDFTSPTDEEVRRALD
ncbi:MAG: hypothetical protein B7X79_04690 [Acidovorax sp. 17-64-282]|nr:MAG: hypothetical protein B7X79_04690 [Acidovorax sp. 17-64-282]HQT19314.1 phosphoribosyltransferase family protein [Acidovorax defluvii]HQT51842.1 phosphoribosyltransferase family protein [Acidovorax defluvii]